MTKWLVEARILARQSPPDIAVHAATSASAVDAYERLFFNVANRLDATGFIFMQTLRKVVRWEVEAKDVDVILRLLGYCGGTVVLDAVTPFLLTPWMNLNALPKEQRILGEKVRRFVNVLTMPVNNKTIGKLFNAYAGVLKARTASETPDASGSMTSEAILADAFAQFDADEPSPAACGVA